MKFGLKQETIDAINKVFASFPQIEEAIIYGSRAKGNFKHGSDIDITLKGDKLTLTVLNKIAWAIDDLLLPYSVDLSIFNKLNNAALAEHINRIGISFYKNERLSRKNEEA